MKTLHSMTIVLGWTPNPLRRLSVRPEGTQANSIVSRRRCSKLTWRIYGVWACRSACMGRSQNADRDQRNRWYQRRPFYYAARHCPFRRHNVDETHWLKTVLVFRRARRSFPSSPASLESVHLGNGPFRETIASTYGLQFDAFFQHQAPTTCLEALKVASLTHAVVGCHMRLENTWFVWRISCTIWHPDISDAPKIDQLRRVHHHSPYLHWITDNHIQIFWMWYHGRRKFVSYPPQSNIHGLA